MKLDIRCDIKQHGIEYEECEMIAYAILESMGDERELHVDFGLLQYHLHKNDDEVICTISNS